MASKSSHECSCECMREIESKIVVVDVARIIYSYVHTLNNDEICAMLDMRVTCGSRTTYDINFDYACPMAHYGENECGGDFSYPAVYVVIKQQYAGIVVKFCTKYRTIAFLRLYISPNRLLSLFGHGTAREWLYKQIMSVGYDYNRETSIDRNWLDSVPNLECAFDLINDKINALALKIPHERLVY